MSETSAGAKVAWERWRQEQFPGFDVWPEPPGTEQAYAAGFAGCLAALEAYRVHLTENARQLAENGLLIASHHVQADARDVEKVREWIEEGLTCGANDHQRCQEANKRCG